jgi:Tfp pilus assembly protein PilF
MAMTALADPLEKGLAALENGHAHLAMSCLEQAMASGKTPILTSYHAYCLALTRTDMNRAVDLCREALLAEPDRPDICLNMGRTLLLAGRRDEAVRVLRLGLTFSADDRLIAALEQLGTRRTPLCPWLPRRHFINKYGGLLRSWLGIS